MPYLEEDYCSNCGKKQSKEYLWKDNKDNKVYCIYCFGTIRFNREKKFEISKYERRNGKKVLKNGKIVL